MKNIRWVTGIIAAIAVTGMMFAGCPQDDDQNPPRQLMLLVTGLSEYNGKEAYVALTLLTKDKGYGEATVSGGNALFSLMDAADGKPLTGLKAYGVTLTIEDSSYTTGLAPTKIFGIGTTTIEFDDLTEVEDESETPAAQKKIEITDIPGAQNNQSITLKLLDIKGETEKATGSGTVSNGTVTIDLTSDSQNFTGFGVYTVRFTVGDGGQVHYQPLLPKTITKETTTLSWGDFFARATQ